MFLLQIAQAPVVFHLANEKGQPAFEVVIPKYTLEEAISWGATLLERYRDLQKEDLDENQKREWEAMYPPIPPTLVDLKRSCASLEGAKEIIQTCIPKAKVYRAVERVIPKKSKDKDGKEVKVRRWHRGPQVTDVNLELLLNQILTGNGAGSLTSLAWRLADLSDTSGHEPPPQKSEDDEEEGGHDPLADTEKHG